jgi:thiamine pyrophosphate-dependent acetolactate synthase large subunit-like protein
MSGAMNKPLTAPPTLERRAVMRALVAERRDLLVVAGLGSTTYDLAAAGDHPLNFYLWGAMGGATMIGLGLALAQPSRRVLVATGDGEMLMGLGGLATVAVQRPTNLAVVVIDNERYAETGLQETHTAHGCDLPGIATAAGFESVHAVRTEAELAALIPLLHRATGPLFASIKVTPDRPPFVLPSNDGVYIKTRFRQALLGAPR